MFKKVVFVGCLLLLVMAQKPAAAFNWFGRAKEEPPIKKNSYGIATVAEPTNVCPPPIDTDSTEKPLATDEMDQSSLAILTPARVSVPIPSVLDKAEDKTEDKDVVDTATLTPATVFRSQPPLPLTLPSHSSQTTDGSMRAEQVRPQSSPTMKLPPVERTVPSQAVPVKKTAEPNVKKVVVKYCPACGREFENSPLKFCPYHGVPLRKR